jgi:hypothetical protein
MLLLVIRSKNIQNYGDFKWYKLCTRLREKSVIFRSLGADTTQKINVVVKWKVRLLLIRDVPRSSLNSRSANLIELYHGFAQSL